MRYFGYAGPERAGSIMPSDVRSQGISEDDMSQQVGDLREFLADKLAGANLIERGRLK